jgi:hypothetical protein
MKNALPRVLAVASVCALALTVSACSAEQGVPGLPGLVAERSADTPPPVAAPTAAPTLPSPTTAPEPTDEPFSTDPTDSTDSTDDPFQSEETTAAPQTSASAYAPTDRYKADQAVCGDAYQATYYYESPSDSSKYFEIYFARASKLKALASKASIPEIKQAITSLQNFNQSLGDAFKARDTTKMSELTRSMTDTEGDYRASVRLLMTCRYGYEMGQ